MTIPPEIPIQKYIKVSSDADLAGFWVDALGWIACYFAQLEGLSYAIVEQFGSASDRKRVLKMKYQDRTDVSRRLICAHLVVRGEAQLSDEWNAFLIEARATAPLRNKILHNPLGINMAAANSIEDPDQGIVLMQEPGRPTIKLGAVQSFAQGLMVLNKRMLDLMHRTGLKGAI